MRESRTDQATFVGTHVVCRSKCVQGVLWLSVIWSMPLSCLNTLVGRGRLNLSREDLAGVSISGHLLENAFHLWENNLPKVLWLEKAQKGGLGTS